MLGVEMFPSRPRSPTRCSRFPMWEVAHRWAATRGKWCVGVEVFVALRALRRPLCRGHRSVSRCSYVISSRTTVRAARTALLERADGATRARSGRRRCERDGHAARSVKVSAGRRHGELQLERALRCGVRSPGGRYLSGQLPRDEEKSTLIAFALAPGGDCGGWPVCAAAVDHDASALLAGLLHDTGDGALHCVPRGQLLGVHQLGGVQRVSSLHAHAAARQRNLDPELRVPSGLLHA